MKAFATAMFLLMTTRLAVAEDPLEEINRWRACVVGNATGFAQTTSEPAETIVKGAYALCQSEEMRYFAYLQKTASDGPRLKFKDISDYLRASFEGEFIAAVLTARSKQ